MPQCFDPKFEILPTAQKEIWAELAPAPRMRLVLYGGTAIALQLGHRQSIDFDFFGADPLDKDEIRRQFSFMTGASVLQDSPDTLVVSADMHSGPVKVSFFGGMGFGRINDPLQTFDGTLLVASLEDLMATKLKTILDRAEAKDYRDIAEMLSVGVSLPIGLAAFRQIFRGEPAEALRAIGYFGDGDLDALSKTDKDRLRTARDSVRDLPSVTMIPGSLAVDFGDCSDFRLK